MRTVAFERHQVIDAYLVDTRDTPVAGASGETTLSFEPADLDGFIEVERIGIEHTSSTTPTVRVYAEEGSGRRHLLDGSNAVVEPMISDENSLLRIPGGGKLVMVFGNMSSGSRATVTTQYRSGFYKPIDP